MRPGLLPLVVLLSLQVFLRAPAAAGQAVVLVLHTGDALVRPAAQVVIVVVAREHRSFLLAVVRWELESRLEADLVGLLLLLRHRSVHRCAKLVSTATGPQRRVAALKL